MAFHARTLPCPPFDIRIDLPVAIGQVPDLKALPARPGVFVIEAEHGETLALATTADLRRAVRNRLGPPASGSRRADLGGLARVVRAMTVGSSFEADWAYLQHARARMPATYRSLLDRWQAWFITCDSGAQFPQWTKTAQPVVAAWEVVQASLPALGHSTAGTEACPTIASRRICVGPFPDKHAAARYIELLEDAFDLCRYHHLLVQAPHAAACAYKEMGRCPAPCDGSVSLGHYRNQMRASIDFACTPIEAWRAQLEQAMERASAALNFEQAKRARDRLERTAKALRPEFRHIDRLERFNFVAVASAERPGWARLMLVRGGWIAPFVDLAADADERSIRDVIEAISGLAQDLEFAASQAFIENLGLACTRLFRLGGRSARRAEQFLPLATLTPEILRDALRHATAPRGDSATAEPEPAVAEQSMGK